MLNNLSISPLNIAPYASNRAGLLPYADYDAYMLTQQTVLAPKNQVTNRQLLPTMNTTKLKTDVFTSRVANSQQAVASAKNSRVDATTYSGLNRSTDISLKQPAAQVKKSLNFLA